MIDIILDILDCFHNIFFISSFRKRLDSAYSDDTRIKGNSNSEIISSENDTDKEKELFYAYNKLKRRHLVLLAVREINGKIFSIVLLLGVLFGFGYLFYRSNICFDNMSLISIILVILLLPLWILIIFLSYSAVLVLFSLFVTMINKIFWHLHIADTIEMEDEAFLDFYDK